ncbi:ECs_2282 family putative zinc-binding protein [Proteus mirabilis]|uniref:ECs_2282 family putative zinc-binding protein n=1 Tax=Proteus mirabilis TaxID=584 RepID=UPI003D9C44F9
MSNISFKCSGCHQNLIVNPSINIERIEDFIDTKCSSCGRIIREHDLARQAKMLLITPEAYSLRKR